MFVTQTSTVPPRWLGSFDSLPAPTKFVDASGYAVFSSDDDGAAHVMAHRMLDEGRMADGYGLLGRWLEGRRGHGARWVHLQWHMAVFEVANGLWENALARFTEHILPSVPAGDAVTDAPALLWRISLATRAPANLPWEPVRRVAAERMGTGTAYVELHHLLALAGAGDASGLDAWIRSSAGHLPAASERILMQWAMGLRAYVARDWAGAVRLLEPDVPAIQRIGGSKAQNQLFVQIWREAHRRSSSGAHMHSRARRTRRGGIGVCQPVRRR